MQDEQVDYRDIFELMRHQQWLAEKLEDILEEMKQIELQIERKRKIGG